MVKSKVNNLKELIGPSLNGEKFEIIEEKTSILTAPGEHYGSIMLAVDLIIEAIDNKTQKPKQKTLNLVAKLPPVNEMLRIAFDINVTFKKEVFAYSVTIPTLEKLEMEYNIPKEKSCGKLFPKCYGARLSLDPTKNELDKDGVLIFENLKIQGYKTEDRLVGFDLDATKIILKDLALFHAIPLALKLLKPNEFKEKVAPSLVKNKGLEQLPPEVGAAYHNAIMDGVMEIPELAPHLERIKKMMDYSVANPYVNRPPPKEPWGTMTHADFWTSNTMLLKDPNSGKPIANKIVDLQLMRYYSPITDLVFFLFTSVINSVLDSHYDELIQWYHKNFIEALEQFNIDTSPFKWDKFLEELQDVGPSEVYHVLIMLKPIFTEKGKVQNSSENFQDSDWTRKDLLGPNHKRKLKTTILAFIERNWM